MKRLPTSFLRLGLPMTSNNILYDRLSDRDIEVIRMALRAQEERHKKDGFSVLVIEISQLRAKITDYLIDRKISIG